MSSGPESIGARYANRNTELAAATQGPVDGPDKTGTVLCFAGDLLRRSKLLGEKNTDGALSKLNEPAVLAFLGSIDVDAERASLKRGLDEAFEAILAEGEERTMFATSAFEALYRRDRLASARRALEKMGDKQHAEELSEKEASIDAGLVQKARMLVGLNEMRHAELLALNESDRTSAWWFASLVDADPRLYTADNPSAHTSGWSESDARAAALAAPPKTVDGPALWRREMDTATPAERRFIDSQSKQSAAIKQAIALLDEDD